MYHGERFNSISHLFGAGLAVLGSLLLIVPAAELGDPWKIISFSIYGAMLIALYVCSTLYHSVRGRAKAVLQKFDHCSIYLLIAGSYTPFSLLVLGGGSGWLVFSVIWVIALTGISLEAFWVNRSKIVSAIIYVGMSWFIIFFIGPLAAALGPTGLAWLLLGGAFYTLGAVIYALKRIPWHHPVWHLFVLGGSFCHFLAVLSIRI